MSEGALGHGGETGEAGAGGRAAAVGGKRAGGGKKSGRGGPAVPGYPESVTRLIEELAKLPGIGRRSAERVGFHILKGTSAGAEALARAISDAKARVRHCRVCYNLMDRVAGGGGAAGMGGGDLCPICAAAGPSGAMERGVEGGAGERRDASVVMVVEQPKDLVALEQTGLYRGVFHILMGRISPLEGVTAGDLTVSDLLARVDDPGKNLGTTVREVVLALNPTLEGDGTALYLAGELERRSVKVTRLARGLPVGAPLEFASKAVLADAIQGRH